MSSKAKHYNMDTPRLKILRFGVENFMSFREYTEVSFVSTTQADAPDLRLPSAHANHGLLPVMAVYGANAAGKSNLLSALLTLQHCVRRSFRLRPEQDIPWRPWKMDTGESALPTQMDIDFEVEGIRYHYGFIHNKKQFKEEWLHRFKTKRPQVLFHRNHDEESPWYFGTSLKGEKATIAKLTRDNALFLSSAAQYNHPQLSKIYEMIVQGIYQESFIGLRGNPLFFEGDPILEEGNRSTVNQILKAFDLGCVGIKIEKAPESSNQEMLAELFKPEALEKIREAEANEKPAFEILLDRQGEDGESWNLRPQHESRGTQVLLQRINDLLSTEAGLFVIDEIDTSLHPDVAAVLVGLFTSGDSNLRGVQLLFATHDKGLLQHLRRDEVLLVDKTSDGVSTLCVASDYKELRSRDDLRDVYESGRIGGVPILSALPPLEIATVD